MVDIGAGTEPLSFPRFRPLPGTLPQSCHNLVAERPWWGSESWGYVMSDPNMVDFYKRAARLQRDRARGRGFEAAGTLGRSYYQRPPAHRASILWPALFLLATAFVLKGAIFYATGSDLYQSRVADLRGAPGTVERVGGWLMQADPVTLWMAGKIGQGVTWAKS